MIRKLAIAVVLAACFGRLPASAQPQETHRFLFFIDPALAAALTDQEVQMRLVQYVDDLNFIFSKQTRRRFTFDPAIDIAFVTEAPHTGTSGSFPVSNFEVWAHAQLTDAPGFGSYGGAFSLDASGAAVAANLRWDAIHDPSTLDGDSPELEQYWRQIHNLVHEIEHGFGAGLSEYYNLKTVEDRTGVEPLLDLNANNAMDPYWSRRPDFQTDPLFLWTPSLSRSELLDGVRFSNLSVAVIDDPVRGGSSLTSTLPDLSLTRILVHDESTGSPLANVRVRAWNVKSFAPYESQLVADGTTDSNGALHIAWNASFSTFSHALLIKARRDYGMQAKAMWWTIFDSQSLKMIDGSNNHDILVPVTTTPITPVAYDMWKTDNLLIAGSDARTDDPDGDGLNNFAEYAFGLNPNQADSSGAINLSHARDAPNNQTASMTFYESNLASGVQYVVETSVTLENPTWTPAPAPAIVRAAGADRTQTHVELPLNNSEALF